MEFSLLNDEPVAGPGDDLLGTGRAARELAKLLHDSRAATPLTLAVDAGWGMGKSSLMRLVDAELQAREGVHTVWYNAWTSTGADALEGLIKSVLMRFDRRALRRALRRVSEQRALIGAVRAALTLLAGPLGIAAVVDRLWRDLSVDARSRNAMRDTLCQLTTDWAESTPYDTRRLLVVFVDDLDRCSEETVLAVCEAVKVYLDVPGLAFVIGCDRSALGPSGLLRDLSPAGSAFMEKIFQTSYRVPVPAAAEVRAYVDRCAERSGIQDLLGEHLAELIALRSARNPRRIKRLINGFGLECALNPVWESFSSEAVIRVLLLQQLYPEFYRVLLARDGADVHAAREFLRYRTARRVLSQPFAQPAEGTWPVAVSCLLAYDLVAPEPDRPEDWGTLLARLEEHLPTGFPELALDPNFVRLIEELMALTEVEDMVGQLQRGRPGSRRIPWTGPRNPVRPCSRAAPGRRTPGCGSSGSTTIPSATPSSSNCWRRRAPASGWPRTGTVPSTSSTPPRSTCSSPTYSADWTGRRGSPIWAAGGRAGGIAGPPSSSPAAPPRTAKPAPRPSTRRSPRAAPCSSDTPRRPTRFPPLRPKTSPCPPFPPPHNAHDKQMAGRPPVNRR